MNWPSRWIGFGILALGALAPAGCTTGLTALTKPDNLPAAEVPEVTEAPAPRLTRSQRPEGTGVSLKAPTGVLDGPPPAPALEGDVKQANATMRGQHISVRAWVNGLPVFEDEVLHLSADKLRLVQRLSEPTRSEKLAEVLNGSLDMIIEQELLYQDAARKLEKVAKAMDSLKDYVNQELEKQFAGMRKGGVPEEHIRIIEPIHRRILERSLISQEYVRNRIRDYIKSNSRLEEINEYYENHQNEFQTVDKVKWQDVFIAVGDKRTSVAEARRYAEQLLQNCHTAEDFAQLAQYDDGDSKLRGGEGHGQRRGEIRPAELEDLLFRLKDGEVGPIVESATGVHVIRMLKRDYAGIQPLDESTQKAIKRKLESQLAEREFRRIIREIRTRSVVVKEAF